MIQEQIPISTCKIVEIIHNGINFSSYFVGWNSVFVNIPILLYEGQIKSLLQNRYSSKCVSLPFL